MTEVLLITGPCFRCGDADRHGVLLPRLRGPEGRRERAQLFQKTVSVRARARARLVCVCLCVTDMRRVVRRVLLTYSCCLRAPASHLRLGHD